MFGAMDAAQAIADLEEISPQVRDVVVVGAHGGPSGSNLGDGAAATRAAQGGRKLVEAAEELRPGVVQLEVATPAGSVFVVRDGDRMIAATTTPEPTVGLVFYDLKTCLRAIEPPKQAAPPAPPDEPEEKADDAAS